MSRSFSLGLDGINSVNGARVSCGANEATVITGDTVEARAIPGYKTPEFASSPSFGGNTPTMG